MWCSRLPRTTGLPDAEEWAKEYVLDQHPAAEATEFFEQMAAGGAAEGE